MTDSATRPSSWELGPFTPHARAILGADPHLNFSCPVTGTRVPWAAKDVFNPGAVVHDGNVCLLVRAEDEVGPFAGTSRIGLALSRDGVHFTLEYDADPDRYVSVAGGPEGAPVRWRVHAETGTRALRPLLFPRPGRFDSLLVEPGPPAVATSEGIVLLYNGANHPRTGDLSLPSFGYQPGQVLFDRSDPASSIARAMHPFLTIGANGTSNGQVDNVCFAQALVQLDGQWLLYFGMADSRIGAASAPVV